MLRGIVIGNIVSTRKQDALVGSKFMEVQLMEKGEKIEKYIIENLSENIYIPDLCNRFGISKNMLYKLFNDEFSSTVNGFIIKKRMDLARQMLKDDKSMNVTEIALRCGFSDYNYFIRTFKKHVGVTPLKYRKSGG